MVSSLLNILSDLKNLSQLEKSFVDIKAKKELCFKALTGQVVHMALFPFIDCLFFQGDKRLSWKKHMDFGHHQVCNMKTFRKLSIAGLTTILLKLPFLQEKKTTNN